MRDDAVVLEGAPSPYEPAKGGLGFEIFRALQLHKNKIIEHYIDDDESCTYEEVFERSKRLSLYLLHKKNFKEDDIVCLCSHNQMNCIVPFLASKFIDVNYASIEPTMPEEDLIYLFEYTKPKVVFVADNVESKIEKCLEIANLKTDIIVFGKSEKYITLDEILKTTPDDNGFQPVFIEDLYKTAVTFFSSGTTGKPKGICCNHYSLLAQTVNNSLLVVRKGTINLSNFSNNFGDIPDGEQGHGLIYSPMYWVSGVLTVLINIFLGNTRFAGAVFDAKKAWETINKHKITNTFLPPGQVVDLYLSRDKNSNNNLEVFMTGGGPVKTLHLEYIQEMFPNSIVCQLLGMTEMATLVSTFGVRDEKLIELQKKYPASCGMPSFNNICRIVDPDTEIPCKRNEQGELRLKSKYLMNGYYKMDSTSAFDSEGWFKTGDLAYVNDENCLFIVDRIKDILLYTLYNIRPSVIEDILVQHPSVYECFVVGIPHIEDNEHPLGVVLLKDEYKGKVEENEILVYVNERVPADRYKIRAGIKFVEEMIKTPSGKIKKLAMKNLILEGKL